MKQQAPELRRGVGLKGLALLLFLLALMMLPVGFPLDRETALRDDLANANKALQDRDIGDAEMYFERYLRKNPLGQHRWDVWQNLLTISRDLRQDKASAREYLEIMLEEFAGDAPKRQQIQMQLASLCNDMRAYDRAVALWEALSADPQTPDDVRATVYRELSRAYLRRLEFTLSKEMLDHCLKLDVQPSTKAECLFALAETQMLTEELGDSEKTLRVMLQSEGPTPRQRVLAVFMLADVLEQQEKFSEARELFESIRDSYPNGRVVDIRLASLRNKKSSKPAPPKK